MHIKTDEEIQNIRKSCKILAQVLKKVKENVKIGITPLKLNEIAEKLIEEFGVIPSFKGYKGFPAALCVNVNERVVHGIPDNRKLQDGDIVSIDCGVLYNEMHSDCAITCLVGNVKPEIEKFVKTVEKALYKGIDQIAPGNHIGDIGYTIQKIVESEGYSVIKEYIGHGIGRNLHEPPEIPNFGKKGSGPAFVPGMTICIEPIIAMGSRFADTLPDGWTVVTRDSLPACQTEHTVLVTQNGQEILTKFE